MVSYGAPEFLFACLRGTRTAVLMMFRQLPHSHDMGRSAFSDDKGRRSHASAAVNANSSSNLQCLTAVRPRQFFFINSRLGCPSPREAAPSGRTQPNAQHSPRRYSRTRLIRQQKMPKKARRIARFSSDGTPHGPDCNGISVTTPDSCRPTLHKQALLARFQKDWRPPMRHAMPCPRRADDFCSASA